METVRKIKYESFVIMLVFLFIGFYFAFQVDIFDFWIRMTSMTFILGIFAIMLNGKANIVPNRLELPIILIVSVLSYVLFLFFDLISFFVPLFKEHIVLVYNLANEQNILVIIFCLIIISFFEEIIWRGFITEFLLQNMDIAPALIISSILYSVVHIFTGNVALMAGAFFLGLIMGFIYIFTGKVSTTAFIHAIWGILIFVIFPLN
ncbi:CPBP family intramembrane glutamic endopeptidase [Thermosipho atlanticus]|uniref:CAAX prenyl protease 2/Lysostaphin resistance protein A-like domain-containing protein n=1 Tax=Thermosipho atlanticus DSM 15807 TaxID=1123380 RepID=A0A1M5S4W6_9BACT|nr:CPBP family intramembrane glutamic endopeptidase [Thermosipho atlanticus]SHH33485.1 hypothetical protein SAMN02745199_0800 [Thermosipho atlanticus DSM 15807]